MTPRRPEHVDASVVESAIRLLGPTPTIVAIDGMSASGKSTMARWLAERLDAAVVHGDDFYADLTDDVRAALSPRDGVERFFDHARVRREALVPLLAGRTARFGCFDWPAGGGMTDPVEIEPRPIVVLEGVYSSRPEFADLVALSVLVVVDDDQRRRRQRERHDPLSMESRWDAAERWYFEHQRPPASFDLVMWGG